MGLLTGKRALIAGLASNRSIAYGIADAFQREGATLALTYQNERLGERVKKMASAWDGSLVLPCDVSDDTQIEQLASELKAHWDGIDIVVHSIAFAPGDQLEGDYLEVVNREGFGIAHDISSYSFVALAKGLLPMLNENASLLTMTYLGAEKVVPNYNVMGIAKASLEANIRYMASSLGPKGMRVNGISAGPIRTLAASGIKSFKKMLDYNEKVAPLRKNVTITEVGNAAAFLSSDYASGITGEILHVDAGFHSVAIGEALFPE